MLAKIADSLVEALTQAGMQAGRAYPSAPAPDKGLFLRLGIAGAEQTEAGFARFLGLKEREEDKAMVEVYGMKCRLELRLDIYAGMESANAAADCESAMDDIMQALAQYGGLKIRSVKCGQAQPDRATGLFLCPCAMKAEAELMFEKGEEAGEFTDFILKGELRR